MDTQRLMESSLANDKDKHMNTEERLGGCGAETEYSGRVRKPEKSGIIDLKKKKICLMC